MTPEDMLKLSRPHPMTFNTVEDAVRMLKIQDITRGYTPECVAACIKAVEAEAHFWNTPHDCSHDADCDWCTENCEEPQKAMDHAISLLPKGQPDAT
jgi:hypothetical protein